MSHHFWGFIFKNSCKMICLLKILFIFEVRNTFISNDANTETKTKGRRTVESTAVILMHRMGVLRSDLPPLFNQNSFIMRNTNDGANCPTDLANSAETIIKGLSNSEFVSDLREDLREMIDAYLLSEDEIDYRLRRHASFLSIDFLLRDAERYLIDLQIKLAS